MNINKIDPVFCMEIFLSIILKHHAVRTKHMRTEQNLNTMATAAVVLLLFLCSLHQTSMFPCAIQCMRLIDITTKIKENQKMITYFCFH